MQLVNQTILVTGGAGFIGSHLIELLISQKNHVIVFDNFTSSVLTPRQLENLGATVIKGDLLNLALIQKACQNIDVVIAMAAAHVRLSFSQPDLVHAVNATGTFNTLLAAKKARVKRFVYISSSEVYGTAQAPLIAETHPIDPTTVYGMSKYVGECYTRHFNAHEGVETLIVRPFNSYGPREHFEGYYGEVIPRMTINALTGRPPTVFGKGLQTRDFTYVTDTACGIMQAAASDKLVGDVVNIACGHEISINTIVSAICAVANPSLRPAYKPNRPNDVMRHAADIAKAKALIDFQPKISITEGITKYVTWLQKTYPDVSKLSAQIPDINW